MSNRRHLLVILTAAAVAPQAVLAQSKKAPGKLRRVGFLAIGSRPPALESHALGGFPRGMRDLGYVEEKNLAIELRYAEGRYERFSPLAAELVQLKVDVIVSAGGTTGTPSLC